ncbi:hypothetical protein MCEMSEM18_02280 [Comamonadaceae bacterium]
MPQVAIQSATHGACAILQLRGGIGAAVFIRVLKLSTLMCLYPPLYAQPIAKDAPTPTALAADMFETVTKLPLTVKDMYGKTIDGGKAAFAAFGPVGTDGNRMLSKGMQLWRPVLDHFINKQCISMPPAAGAPPASGLANIDDVSKLPLVRQDVKDTGYARFLTLDTPGAIAIGLRSEWAFVSDDNLVWAN